MEEMDIGETPEGDIKEIEIIEANNKYKYKCQFEIIKEYLFAYIYDNDIIKYKGNMHIVNIQYHLGVYKYNIYNLFNDIYELNHDKFKLIQDINKNKLRIEFNIFNKKRYINITLYNYNNNDNDNDKDYFKIIKEIKEIIKEKDNKIKLLQEELIQLKTIEDNINKKFNFKDKEPKYTLQYHSGIILCSTVLNDGRFVTGSDDKSIIIYNNRTFQHDLIIKEHKAGVNCVIQLSSGELVSCSDDESIKIYKINKNKYQIIQKLIAHDDSVSKIIELKNEQLVSCSGDNSIILYEKSGGAYIYDYSISTKGWSGPIIQTKDNEICYYEKNNSTICFFDFINKKNIKKLNSISVTSGFYDSLLMISKDLLLITGYNKISIINVNSYNLIRTVNSSNSSWINAACKLNKDMIITADENKRIIVWKIRGDNIKLISIKEDAHDERIYTLSTLGNGIVLSGGDDCSIKIWEI